MLMAIDIDGLEGRVHSCLEWYYNGLETWRVSYAKCLHKCCVFRVLLPGRHLVSTPASPLFHYTRKSITRSSLVHCYYVRSHPEKHFGGVSFSGQLWCTWVHHTTKKCLTQTIGCSLVFQNCPKTETYTKKNYSNAQPGWMGDSVYLLIVPLPSIIYLVDSRTCSQDSIFHMLPIASKHTRKKEVLFIKSCGDRV